MTARASQLSLASFDGAPQLVRAPSMASVPSPSTVNWLTVGCTANVASGSMTCPRSASVPPMRARCSSGSWGASTAYQRAMGASLMSAPSCRPLPLGTSCPCHWPWSTAAASALRGVASMVPASVLPSRFTVATRPSNTIGCVPSAATSALQGEQRTSSTPAASFQAKCRVPKRLSNECPSSRGANHEEVARRTAVGTPTAKRSGPASTVVLHSPAAGASTSFTIRKIATQVVTTRASSP